jgi:hypothetical protein
LEFDRGGLRFGLLAFAFPDHEGELAFFIDVQSASVFACGDLGVPDFHVLRRDQFSEFPKTRSRVQPLQVVFSHLAFDQHLESSAFIESDRGIEDFDDRIPAFLNSCRVTSRAERSARNREQENHRKKRIPLPHCPCPPGMRIDFFLTAIHAYANSETG